jgi:hypothetical protein
MLQGKNEIHFDEIFENFITHKIVKNIIYASNWNKIK